MKKPFCFYDHDVKVKILDNILSHSKNWNWFFKYNEENFWPDIDVNSFDAAINAFFNVSEIFTSLCRIREVCDVNFNISQQWLYELDQLALLYSGKLDLQSVKVNSEFAKINKLLIFSGKIYSQIRNKKYTMYNRIFKTRNLFSLENIDLFIEEKDSITKLIDDIKIDMSIPKAIFNDNINQITIPANTELVNRHINDFYNANCFNFYSIHDTNAKTWEDDELLKMLSVSYKDSKIVPIYSNGEETNPEYQIWTESVLNHIKKYYNSEYVDFIVESITYALYRIQPSSFTANKHVELLLDYYKSIKGNENANYDCSSLNFIISLMSDCKELFSEESFKKYNAVLKILFECEQEYLLFEIKDNNALTNKKIAKELNNIINQKIGAINGISNHISFINYVTDKRIKGGIGNKHISQLSEIFHKLIYENDYIVVATLFLNYFLFLLNVKNNINVSAKDISSEIIRIRELWQKEFFQKTISSMSTVKSGPIVITKEQEDCYVYSIMSSPYIFALNSMKLGKNQLIECMSSISQHPFSFLATRINICEDFPQKPFLKVDNSHPIDELFFKEIEKEKSEKSYKLLNNFKTEKFISGIYDRIKNELRFKMAILKNVKPLYDAIIKQLPEYDFIDFSEEPTLAHLTQLFPLLEKQIRKLGELFNIVPVCESEDMCHRLKEPHTILKIIILEVFNFDGSLETVSDLLFVHFCMYGENGLNIRNDCVHGNHYCKKEEILFAFKIALISLYIINFRYEAILEHLEETD